MSDEQWYWCLEHKKPEQGKGCPEKSRMGPYPSEEAARRWQDKVDDRNDRWDDDDARWRH